MMQYDFYILTTEGIKSHLVNSESDFTCAPFGHVPYKVLSSCTCEPDVIENFWLCVDSVLQAHNLTPVEFIRAIRAYSEGKLYGEFDG